MKFLTVTSKGTKPFPEISQNLHNFAFDIFTLGLCGQLKNYTSVIIKIQFYSFIFHFSSFLNQEFAVSAAFADVIFSIIFV